MFKNLFGKGKPSSQPQELTIEDLIVLERYEEAIERLERRAHENPSDLHAHLRLAEVLSQVGKGGKALDQYLYVADMYTDDGFYDKALALLTKLARLAPGDDSIRLKTARIQRLKQLEHSRVLVIEGLVEAQKEQDPLARISPIEVEKIWQALAATSIVDRLPGEQLRRLFAGCEPWAVDAKALVAKAGSRDEYLYILVSGSVEARLTPEPGTTYELRVFLPGDVFGERSLLEHLPWPADYIARERSKFVRVNAEGLTRAMTGNPDPRGMLDALRAKHLDRDVATAAEKLLRPGGA